MRTDLKGAAAFGLDSMFVISGIHAEQYGSREAPDLGALNAIFTAAGVDAESDDARACLVKARRQRSNGRLDVNSIFSANTASILDFSVWALNGLTM